MKDLKLPKAELEDTLVYAIEDGKTKGFTEEFTFKDGSFIANDKNYLPYQVEVIDNKRFEGMSNPADSMIYFSIAAHDGVKGYFISSYGVGANNQAMEFLMKADD